VEAATAAATSVKIQKSPWVLWVAGSDLKQKVMNHDHNHTYRTTLITTLFLVEDSDWQVDGIKAVVGINDLQEQTLRDEIDKANPNLNPHPNPNPNPNPNANPNSKPNPILSQPSPQPFVLPQL